MKRLDVLYDVNCGFCRRCRDFLLVQPKHVPLRLLPQHAAITNERYPGLCHADANGWLDELVVVADDGRVWRGHKAMLVCLWALRDYRGLAVRMSRPGLVPLGAAGVRHGFAAAKLAGSVDGTAQ